MKKIFLATLVASAALFTSCGNSNGKAELKTDVDSVSYAFGAINCAQSIGDMQNLKQGLMQMGSDSAAIEDFLRGLKDGFESAENKEQVAYYLGASIGMNLRTQSASNLDGLVYGDDSTKHVDVNNVLAGFMDALQDTIAIRNAEGKKMSMEELFTLYQTKAKGIYDGRVRKQYTKELQAEAAFFAQLKKDPAVKPLADGVYYKVITPATGATLKQGQYAEVEYTGKLTDGHQFDSNAGKPTKFPVGVGFFVPGFDAALSAMGVGAEWEVYIPAEQAYGFQGKGDIKPCSTLIFRIKVLSVEDAPAQPGMPQ